MSLQSGNEAAFQHCATTFTVTLFRSRKTKQLLFLEAGKDFVDTLFSFLILPMGTIVNILSQGLQMNSLGGITCISESLDSTFLHVDKSHLVRSRPAAAGCTCCPTASGQFEEELVAANMMQSPPFSPELYRCNGCGLYSRDLGARCRACNSAPTNMNHTYCGGPFSVKLLDNPTREVTGFVKENSTFIVTDELKIIPSSISTSIRSLKRLQITSVDDLESNEITVSITQIVELLQSALISKNCLSDVFGKIFRVDLDFSGY